MQKIMFTLALLLTVLPVHAEVLVKCFQAQMVHKGDCNTNLGAADCAPALIDLEPQYWVYLPQALCEKITGQAVTTDNSAASD